MKKMYLLFLAATLFLVCNKTNVVAQGMSVSANGASPDNSAMLDVSSANHGLLIPRVALTSLTDQTTIASPATYLTIYNTNAAIGNGTGMYYWSGSTWMYMSSASNGNGAAGQVLTSQGIGSAPQWNSIPPSGGGGSICACFNNYQVFTSSGNFTTSSTTTLVKVQVWGGGGGGSGANTGYGYAGAGGGGGGYAEGIFVVTPSTNYSVTVGAGGTGGTANGGAGVNGGNSSFDIFISASGGTGASYINNVPGPGQGGFGNGGFLNSSLGSGGQGGYETYFLPQQGNNNGGSAGGFYGGGGGGGVGGGNGGQNNSPGNNAQANSGAGGGGAGYSGVAAGGNGGSGLLIVYY